MIARDILAIPVSSVASESAFSMGGWVVVHIVQGCMPKPLKLWCACKVGW